MQPQLIEDGQITSDTIHINDLIELGKQILKDSISKGQMDDNEQSMFIQKYQKFALEYPSVFNVIMMEKHFYVAPFKKYITFKSKQPLVYTTSEQSVKDLCYYPLQLFKHLNKHYDQTQYNSFKQELYNNMTIYHNDQKERLKTISKSVIDKQQVIKQSLIDNLLKLAVQTQLTHFSDHN